MSDLYVDVKLHTGDPGPGGLNHQSRTTETRTIGLHLGPRFALTQDLPVTWVNHNRKEQIRWTSVWSLGGHWLYNTKIDVKPWHRGQQLIVKGCGIFPRWDEGQ